MQLKAELRVAKGRELEQFEYFDDCELLIKLTIDLFAKITGNNHRISIRYIACNINKIKTL